MSEGGVAPPKYTESEGKEAPPKAEAAKGEGPKVVVEAHNVGENTSVVSLIESSLTIIRHLPRASGDV